MDDNDDLPVAIYTHRTDMPRICRDCSTPIPYGAIAHNVGRAINHYEVHTICTDCLHNMTD